MDELLLEENLELQDWSMPEYVEEFCENIDATFFSGDSMHSPSASKRMREYLERWTLHLDVIEKGQAQWTWLPNPDG